MRVAVCIAGSMKVSAATVRRNIEVLLEGSNIHESNRDILFCSYDDDKSIDLIRLLNIDCSILIKQSSFENKYVHILTDDRLGIRNQMCMFLRNKYLFDFVKNSKIYTHILYMRPDLNLSFNFFEHIESNSYIMPRPHSGNGIINHIDHCGFGKVDIVSKAWDFGDQLIDKVHPQNSIPYRSPEFVLKEMCEEKGIKLEYFFIDHYSLIRE